MLICHISVVFPQGSLHHLEAQTALSTGVRWEFHQSAANQRGGVDAGAARPSNKTVQAAYTWTLVNTVLVDDVAFRWTTNTRDLIL